MAVHLLFYFFASILIASAGCVIFSRNTVYAALSLMVAFFNAAVLMLIAGAEFVSFMIIVVYIGAVAVLFLFVVMMLNLKNTDLKASFGPYLIAALGVGGVLLIEACIMAYFFEGSPEAFNSLAFPRPRKLENIYAIGEILYTHYAFAFQIAGVILFVAMIGAIVLTEGVSRERRFLKQNTRDQNRRSKENSMALTSPTIGKGVIPGHLPQPSV
jgi:NADH-quinone oxidoreductase subunit J